MSHTSPDDITEKTNDKTITNNDDKYKDEDSKIQEGNESVDDSETLDTLLDDSITKTTKEEEALIQGLMTMNFRFHLIQSVIDIFFVCEGKL